MLSRRTFTLGTAATLVTACAQAESQVTNTKMTGAPLKETPMTSTDQTNWANLTSREWRERLTEQEFHVLRKEGTERPWTSDLNDEKRAGTFVCAGCALPLFTTDMKFDSGTGWPSFFDYIEGAIETKKDFKLIVPRTEYHCSRCGGHQGHVFKDGPRPTGLRYCNNGVALDFIPDT